MRKIIIPEDVQIETFNQETQTVEEVMFSFKDFLLNNALSHHSWGESIETIEQCVELESQLVNCQPGDQFLVHEEVFNKLNTIVNYPKQPYDIKVAKKLLSFFRAIRHAEEIL